MKFSTRLALIVVTLIACVGCDQAIKQVAKETLTHDSAITFLAGGVRLQLAHNDGAFLSLGASLPAAWRHGLLSIGVGCVLAGLLIYALVGRGVSRVHVFAFAMVGGGGFSNLLDRLMYGGYVVDYINVGVNIGAVSLRTGIFNAADVCISLGVVLLLTGEFLERRFRRMQAS